VISSTKNLRATSLALLSFVSNAYLNLGTIRALDITSDGEYIVAADSLSNVWLLNSNLQIMGRSYLNVFPEPLTLGPVNAVRFSPDGKYIGAAHSNTPYYFALLDHTNPGSISIITSYKLPGAVNPEGLAFSYN
jgi:WD40 repeat protein